MKRRRGITGVIYGKKKIKYKKVDVKELFD